MRSTTPPAARRPPLAPRSPAGSPTRLVAPLLLLALLVGCPRSRPRHATLADATKAAVAARDAAKAARDAKRPKEAALAVDGRTLNL